MNHYFYGWYFKCQSRSQTLAIIPAVHETNENKTYSIQIITEEMSWNRKFRHGEMQTGKKKGRCYRTWHIGKNTFGSNGLHLDINSQNLKAKGYLHFSNHTPLKYDIMGPFAFIPFLECRHYVYSMQYRVNGRIDINGKTYLFKDAWGYWEGDSGRSFPKEYAWTQSFLFHDKNLTRFVPEDCYKTTALRPYGNIMLSVADIPFMGIHFTGAIGIVDWKGKRYRFATYLGTKVIQNSKNRLLVKQGNMEFEAILLEENTHVLQAPVNGAMSRTIHENLTCRAFYRLRINEQTVFAIQTEKASFEFEY